MAKTFDTCMLAATVLVVLTLCPGCWFEIEHIQAQMWLDVAGQILDEGGQPMRDAPVAVSIGTPATADQLAGLLADPDSAANGQRMAGRGVGSGSCIAG